MTPAPDEPIPQHQHLSPPIKKPHLLNLSLNFSSCTTSTLASSSAAAASASSYLVGVGALDAAANSLNTELRSHFQGVNDSMRSSWRRLVASSTGTRNPAGGANQLLPAADDLSIDDSASSSAADTNSHQQDSTNGYYDDFIYQEAEIPTKHLKNYLSIISQLKSILHAHKSSKKTELQNRFKLQRQDMNSLRKKIPDFYFHEQLDKNILIKEIVEKQGRSLNLYQEKVMYWLEQIEELLSLRLRMQYADIIELLLRLHDLDAELTQVLQQIEDMKQNLSQMKKVCVYDRVQIVKMARRKKNLDRLLVFTRQIEHFQRLQEKILSNEDSENYLPLFGWIDESIQLIQKNLHKLDMFRGKSEALENKKKRLVEKIQKEFNHLLIFSPLNKEDSSVPTSPISLSRKSSSDLLNLSQVLYELNLLNLCMERNREAYFENMKSQFKDIIDNVLAFVENDQQHSDGSTTSGSSEHKKTDTIPAHQVRLLQHQHFMFLAQRLFETVLHWMRQAYAVDQFFNQHFPELTLSSPLHVEITRMAFTRLSLIFSLRSNSPTTPQKHELIELALKLSSFQRKCFALTNDPLTEQRRDIIEGPIFSFLRSQAKSFFDQFHNDQMSKLQGVMEHEDWTWVKHVPKNFQNMVRRFMFLSHCNDAYDRDSQEKLDAFQQEDEDILNSGELSPEATQQKFLHIDGKSFPVANCVLILFCDMWDYMELLLDQNLKYLLDPEAVCKGLLSLIRLFNDESRSLVLHARAVKTVDIQRITAKHLILSSECIHALSTFVPHLRTIFLLVSNRKHVMAQTSTSDIIPVPHKMESFDVLLDECDNMVVGMNEYRREITEKLEYIMSKRLIQAANTWKSCQWDSAEVTVPTSQIVSILKDMAQVYRILSTYLSTHRDELKQLFTQIMTMYYDRLSKSMREVNCETSEGKKKVMDDISLVKKNVDKWSNCLKESFQVERLQKEGKEIFGR